MGWQKILLYDKRYIFELLKIISLTNKTKRLYIIGQFFIVKNHGNKFLVVCSTENCHTLSKGEGKMQGNDAVVNPTLIFIPKNIIQAVLKGTTTIIKFEIPPKEQWTVSGDEPEFETFAECDLEVYRNISSRLDFMVAEQHLCSLSLYRVWPISGLCELAR